MMGNCTVKGTALGCSVRGTAVICSAHRATAVAAAVHVRVMTDSGGIMEFEGPIQAGDVLVGFPRHGIFQHGDVSSPLFHHERLQNGRLYYLLPLQRRTAPRAHEVDQHVRCLEVLPPQMKGVWRVKLAIGAEHLAGILSEQVNAEALIERMRILATAAEAVPAHAKPQGGAGWTWRAPVALPTVSKLRSCERM